MFSLVITSTLLQLLLSNPALATGYGVYTTSSATSTKVVTSAGPILPSGSSPSRSIWSIRVSYSDSKWNATTVWPLPVPGSGDYIVPTGSANVIPTGSSSPSGPDYIVSSNSPSGLDSDIPMPTSTLYNTISTGNTPTITPYIPAPPSANSSTACVSYTTKKHKHPHHHEDHCHHDCGDMPPGSWESKSHHRSKPDCSSGSKVWTRPTGWHKKSYGPHPHHSTFSTCTSSSSSATSPAAYPATTMTSRGYVNSPPAYVNSPPAATLITRRWGPRGRIMRRAQYSTSTQTTSSMPDTYPTHIASSKHTSSTPDSYPSEITSSTSYISSSKATTHTLSKPTYPSKPSIYPFHTTSLKPPIYPSHTTSSMPDTYPSDTTSSKATSSIPDSYPSASTTYIPTFTTKPYIHHTKHSHKTATSCSTTHMPTITKYPNPNGPHHCQKLGMQAGTYHAELDKVKAGLESLCKNLTSTETLIPINKPLLRTIPDIMVTGPYIQGTDSGSCALVKFGTTGTGPLRPDHSRANGWMFTQKECTKITNQILSCQTGDKADGFVSTRYEMNGGWVSVELAMPNKCLIESPKVKDHKPRHSVMPSHYHG
ncbi:hypothetical protein K440DRAFT_663853 [Wilcoxina mikolae CBS 423.85]|nr:hypothetical protein K440DRAFT_663853 [Wilcoxina mikolae CBS 423.85]